MKLRYVLPIFALPSALFAQSEQEIFSCTFNGGQHHVEVTYLDDVFTYQYGPISGAPELVLRSSRYDIDYAPNMWDSYQVSESVTFYNDDTTYEVFSDSNQAVTPSQISIPRESPQTNAGIVISQGEQTLTRLVCDTNSVAPSATPMRNLGQIFPLVDPVSSAFEFCTYSGILVVQYCLGIITVECQNLEKAGVETCPKPESEVWDLVLEGQLDDTLRIARDRGDAALVARIEAAHKAWLRTRAYDCAIADWSIYAPFDAKRGMHECLSDMTAHRVAFLRNLIEGLEFDG